jgi:hypothetical protein
MREARPLLGAAGRAVAPVAAGLQPAIGCVPSIRPSGERMPDDGGAAPERSLMLTKIKGKLRDQRIRRLFDQGMSRGQISRLFGDLPTRSPTRAVKHLQGGRWHDP